MTEIQNPKQKQYDLEERTFLFAKRVNAYVNKLPKTIPNIENGKQLVKAAGSTGANYIEANESLSKKDFIMRIKICRKESKESQYWLRLLDTIQDSKLESERKEMIGEPTELMKIFSSIMRKSERKL